MGVATYAVSWLQNNPEHETIRSVLEQTGFVDYVSKNPLDKTDFIEAVKYAPNVKENYYTILTDKNNLDKLIDFVNNDSYFNRLVK